MKRPLSGVDTARVLWRKFELENARAKAGLVPLSDDEVDDIARAELARDEPAMPDDASPPAPRQGSPASEGEANPVKRSHTQERAERLAAVVDAIESRARERDCPFDRNQWPGTKREFRDFLTWHARSLAYQLPADDGRLSDELRQCGVRFARPGRDKTKGMRFYRAIFPDYPA